MKTKSKKRLRRPKRLALRSPVTLEDPVDRFFCRVCGTIFSYNTDGCPSCGSQCVGTVSP